MKTLLILPLLAMTSCSAGVATEPVRSTKAETKLNQLLAGKVAGRTSSCINQRDATEQRIIDERTIIFRTGRNKLYRTEIDQCPRLDNRSTLIRQTTGTNICSGEIFEVRDSGTGMSYGACTFGDFTEYRTAAR